MTHLDPEQVTAMILLVDATLKFAVNLASTAARLVQGVRSRRSARNRTSSTIPS